MSTETIARWQKSHPKQLHLRSDTTWCDWLEEVGRACRRSKAGLIDEALIYFARGHGFPPPPPRLGPPAA